MWTTKQTYQVTGFIGPRAASLKDYATNSKNPVVVGTQH